jgi:hypothetical protein
MNIGHRLIECSGRGECDHSTGTCRCDINFGGAACEKLSCPSDGFDDDCSGHGRCLPMWRLAEEAQTGEGDAANYAYGSVDTELNPRSNWDRNMIHGCHCDTRNDYQPYNGPKAYVSGWRLENPKLGGWTGYDCSRRWCPTGDDPQTHGNYEVQVIGCQNTTENFTVTFRGETTIPIDGRLVNESDIKAALEGLTTIGEVDVEFPRDYKVGCHPDFGDPFYFMGIEVTFLTELGDLPLMTTKIRDGARVLKVRR